MKLYERILGDIYRDIGRVDTHKFYENIRSLNDNLLERLLMYHRVEKLYTVMVETYTYGDLGDRYLKTFTSFVPMEKMITWSVEASLKILDLFAKDDVNEDVADKLDEFAESYSSNFEIKGHKFYLNGKEIDSGTLYQYDTTEMNYDNMEAHNLLIFPINKHTDLIITIYVGEPEWN